MTYLLIALGIAAGLYVLWKIFTICLSLFTPVKIKGQSYLYAQLNRIGVQTLDVSSEIVNAAVELAELSAKDRISGKMNYEVFCHALDGYAAVIRDKLQNAPFSPEAKRSWEAIQERSMQNTARPGQSESRQ
jgi:hypothetical protein